MEDFIRVLVLIILLMQHSYIGWVIKRALGDVVDATSPPSVFIVASLGAMLNWIGGFNLWLLCRVDLCPINVNTFILFVEVCFTRNCEVSGVPLTLWRIKWEFLTGGDWTDLHYIYQSFLVLELRCGLSEVEISVLFPWPITKYEKWILTFRVFINITE